MESKFGENPSVSISLKVVHQSETIHQVAAPHIIWYNEPTPERARVEDNSQFGGYQYDDYLGRCLCPGNTRYLHPPK